MISGSKSPVNKPALITPKMFTQRFDYPPWMRLVYGWGSGLLLVGLLAGVLYCRCLAVMPPHFNAMVDEIYFHGEILTAPVENNSETFLAYTRTVEGGVGIFLVNLESLERHQIMLTKPSENSRGEAVKLFGWSQDDQLLAYSIIVGKTENRNVRICDGETGILKDSFDAPHAIVTGRWLNAGSLVFMDTSQTVYLFNVETNNRPGQYGAKGLVKLRRLQSDESFIVDSDHSISYVERGAIWTFNISTGQAIKLIDLPDATTKLLDCNSTEYKYLLEVTSSNSTALHLCEYDLRANRNSAITSLIDVNYSYKGQWVNGGFVYIGEIGNRNFVAIQTSDKLLATNLFESPSIDEFNGRLNQHLFGEGRQVVRTYQVGAKRDKIFVVASVNYEPLAIWEYDIANQTMRNVVPEKEHLVYSKLISPVQASVTNQHGGSVDYYYLPPANLEKNKKYPMVIDQFSDLGYQPNSQFLANCGIFYVAVFPYGTGRPDRPTDPEDTLAVYNEMLKNPNLDSHRIYLFGESAGTETISRLINDYPDRWRGAIMLSPVAFPSSIPEYESFSSLFFSFGDEDHILSQANMERFAQEACGRLIRTQIEYGHAGHVFFDINELKKRYKAIVKFVLTD